MLCIGRKRNEVVHIGNITVMVLKTGEGSVRLGIEAPRDVPIVRGELAATGCELARLEASAVAAMRPETREEELVRRMGNDERLCDLEVEMDYRDNQRRA